MKNRTGFVSNSSSTSFTCDVCGETQSGMDMSRSDAGMDECINGHTYCEDHEMSFEVSDDEKRKILIDSREKWRDAKWKKPGEVDAEIAEIKALSPDALQDQFDEYIDDAGSPPGACPICQLTTLDDSDIRNYALVKLGFASVREMAAAIKTEFQTYDRFQLYLKENKKT